MGPVGHSRESGRYNTVLLTGLDVKFGALVNVKVFRNPRLTTKQHLGVMMFAWASSRAKKATNDPKDALLMEIILFPLRCGPFGFMTTTAVLVLVGEQDFMLRRGDGGDIPGTPDENAAS